MRSDHEAWAREVLADPKTVVLDTETTGLHGYVVELSVYDGKTFPIDTLVNPEVPIEPGAQRVHRITEDDLIDAPVFRSVWPALAGLLADRRVIVWNAEFDSGVIRREMDRLGGFSAFEAHLVLNWECAMRRYSDWYWNMDDARFMRLNGGHRAGQDCKAVFERLREMAGV
jgi:DNA polymerase III alpha subunit (gram-positive type)